MGLGSLVVVLLGILLVARRMTSGLTSLSDAARKIKGHDYSVRVEVESGDEIGQLGKLFNNMASDIETYTDNLEELVQERTLELEAANEEISTLNTMLTAENVRLCSEIEVARQLQMDGAAPNPTSCSRFAKWAFRSRVSWDRRKKWAEITMTCFNPVRISR